VGVSEVLRGKREEILAIAARHGARNVRVFGSVARGEASEDSDVDFLIEVSGPTTPWFPGGLVFELENLLGRRVDVAEVDALREPVREQVLREAVTL
jgi:predicted nucleotidyltransferase